MLATPQRFIRAEPGAAVWAASFYTRLDSPALRSLHWITTRSDTLDIAYERDSTDNGHTWSPPRAITTGEKRDRGILRRHLMPGYLDPQSGRLLMLRVEGLLRDDNPVTDGTRNWYLRYAVSCDGGATYVYDEPIIEEGAEYSAAHPVAGQWVGRNALMMGAISCTPLTLADGTILVPCQMAPLGPGGEYFNPGGGHTYKEALVLRGCWREDGRIAWQSSARVTPDPERTTRGLIEPTLRVLDDGRVLMVMRGSNDVKPELPGVKWFATSRDDGQSWSTPAPWTYDDGEPFFSPSSCSQLLQHSSGTLLWLGNISPQNPRGNHPRYPLVMGIVNRESGLLIRASLRVVDTRNEGESEMLQLSNFYAREDRETTEIVLHGTRLFAAQQPNTPLYWTADAVQFRLRLED
jgi:hypothetical protein